MPKILEVVYITRDERRRCAERFDYAHISEAYELAARMAAEHRRNVMIYALDDMPNGCPGMMSVGSIEVVFGRTEDEVAAPERAE